MKRITRRIKVMLVLCMLFSCVAGVQLSGYAADGGSVISFGSSYSFERLRLSYHDNVTTTLKISFSVDGAEYGKEYTAQIDNTKEAIINLDGVVKAQYARINDGGAGMPKIELFVRQRFGSTNNVGNCIRGIEGNTKALWTPASSNFAPLFDGIYDGNTGELTNLGPTRSNGMAHDAVKDGKTTNYSDGIVVLNFTFDQEIELAKVDMAIDALDFAEYVISVPDENGEYQEVMSRGMDGFNGIKPMPGWDYGTTKSTYLTSDEIEKTTKDLRIYFHNFQKRNGSGGILTNPEYIDIFEMAFYKWQSVYTTDFALYDGAKFILPEAVTCQRILGQLPENMWYEGYTSNGTWVEFRPGETAGYSALNETTISAVKIKGYNYENVIKAKLPSELDFYSPAKDLAKSAYAKNKDNVTVEGIAKLPDDLGNDPRAEYMIGGKESIDCLFDGDTQYTAIKPYHTFASIDPDRLTLKENSAIKIDLGNKAVIDEIDYYAGPQYTPKKYSVTVGSDKTNGNTVLTKEYQLIDGHISPFTTADQFYCSMRESAKVDSEAVGRYVTIINDGVLKAEKTTFADTLSNKSVILAKEISVIGAELVAAVNTFPVEATCTFNENNTAVNGLNTVTLRIDNKTGNKQNDIVILLASYDETGKLLSVRDFANNTSVEAEDSITCKMENVELHTGNRVRVFVWSENLEPLTVIPSVTVQ